MRQVVPVDSGHHFYRHPIRNHQSTSNWPLDDVVYLDNFCHSQPETSDHAHQEYNRARET